ncbi:TonB-dependent receptor family protein [Niveispirillum fermenti]|uniref:TonB-dependent receptor family protein n=1 Tax=Niveispirillum fermenti TaxID=1233113 RepID=UPI0040429ADF
MKNLLLASSALLGLAITPAVAQDARPVAEGDIVVIGNRAIEEAEAAIRRTAGAVEVVPDTAFKNSPVQTIKDILGYVPGIVVQPRFGDDARLSIRGSGLSRNYGNRGLSIYLDGVPMNMSDGLVDLFEVDPSAYRHVEIFKGANALRYGSNALGGAINLVTPTGRDAARFDGRLDVGSFGYVKGQASTGGVSGALDYFITASGQDADGYRDHSDGHQVRGSGNVGYSISPDVETRFHVNANSIRQRIPGEMTKQEALETPRAAHPAWIDQDQQRNINSVRLANKTTVRLDQTRIEFGLFGQHRHVMHPIFQWLDFKVNDYGGFVRAVDDRSLGDHRNRLTIGANIHNGRIDTRQYINLSGAVKGAVAASMLDKSENISAYAENAFHLRPDLSLIAGVQYLHASRDRRDRFLSNGDQSGRKSYDLWSPRVGVLWDIDTGWQAFANISRSAEVPSYDANSFATPASSNLTAQRATTYEIGTRGGREDVAWDITLYRAEIRNELQCLTTAPWAACSVVNVDSTVHQGIEAGLEAVLLKSAGVADDRVMLNLAYTYNDFFFDGDALYGDNRLPGVPRHFLRAELLYKHPEGFYAGPNVEWAPGHYYADNDNSLTIGSYALLNFRVGYDTGSGWSGYVEGRNLTDRHYISSVAIAGTAGPASQIFNAGTGRAFHGGLRYRW